MKVVALACLIACAGLVAARPATHGRSLLEGNPITTNPSGCDQTVQDYVNIAALGGTDPLGKIIQGTASTGTGDQPPGDATKYYLVKGPGNTGVLGKCARNLCFAASAVVGLPLQLANIDQMPAARIAGNLVFKNVGPVGVYINTAPHYETPREGNSPALHLSSGPIGRNNLVLTPENADGTYDVNPDPPTGGPQPDGPGDQSLFVVCGPLRDFLTVPTPLPPPAFCTFANDDFQGWAITVDKYTAANIQCPFGYSLGNVAQRNLWKPHDNDINPNNLFDGIGFPYLPDLIEFCVPGERVWVNTAPGFTSGNPAGSPPGSPGFCVTVAGVYTGNPQGVDPKKNGGKTDPTNPLCLETHSALCFASSSA